MRLPIKLNRGGWRWRLARVSCADPRPLAGDVAALSAAEFSAAVSTLQFGETFKSTFPGRQEHSNQYLLEVYRGAQPVILDVGASDGSTSVDLIEVLETNFRRYFVTDLNICARCGFDRRGNLYFKDPDGACVLRASKRTLVYANAHGAPYPLPIIASRMVAASRNVGAWRELLLVQPRLLELATRDPRITVLRYDMFTPWKGERPDVIKVANLLNAKYFSAAQMTAAVKIQCNNLAPNGRLLLVSEDDDIEKFSVFVKQPNGMRLEHTHAGGGKAAAYVPLAT